MKRKSETNNKKSPAKKQMKLFSNSTLYSKKKCSLDAPVSSGCDFSDVIKEWRERMGLKTNWQNEIVNQIMDVEYFEEAGNDGKLIKYRKCFCRCHKKFCQLKGKPVTTKVSQGYTNPFSHAVSIIHLYRILFIMFFLLFIENNNIKILKT